MNHTVSPWNRTVRSAPTLFMRKGALPLWSGTLNWPILNGVGGRQQGSVVVNIADILHKLESSESHIRVRLQFDLGN